MYKIVLIIKRRIKLAAVSSYSVDILLHNAPLNMIVSKKRRSTEQEQHHPALTLLLVVMTISFITINIPTVLVLGSFFPGWRQKPIRVRQYD